METNNNMEIIKNMKGLKDTEIYNNIIGMDILKYLRSLGLQRKQTRFYHLLSGNRRKKSMQRLKHKGK